MTHDEMTWSLCCLLGPSYQLDDVTRFGANGIKRSEEGITHEVRPGAYVEISVPDPLECEPEFLETPSASDTYQLNVYQNGTFLGQGHIKTSSMLESDAVAIASHLGR